MSHQKGFRDDGASTCCSAGLVSPSWCTGASGTAARSTSRCPRATETGGRRSSRPSSTETLTPSPSSKPLAGCPSSSGSTRRRTRPLDAFRRCTLPGPQRAPGAQSHGVLTRGHDPRLPPKPVDAAVLRHASAQVAPDAAFIGPLRRPAARFRAAGGADLAPLVLTRNPDEPGAARAGWPSHPRGACCARRNPLIRGSPATPLRPWGRPGESQLREEWR